MIFLDLDALLHIALRTLGTPAEVRDYGLLESALARPQTSAFGEDAYPEIHHKAAALLHSLARNHPLVDGNKRLALAATIAFYGLNGMKLTLTNDEAYALTVDVATSTIDDTTTIATALKRGSTTRSPLSARCHVSAVKRLRAGPKDPRTPRVA